MRIKINGKPLNACGRSKEYLQGAIDVAELVGDQYNSSTIHPYHIGDCTLFKLNIINKRQVRKNKRMLRAK